MHKLVLFLIINFSIFNIFADQYQEKLLINIPDKIDTCTVDREHNRFCILSSNNIKIVNTFDGKVLSELNLSRGRVKDIQFDQSGNILCAVIDTEFEEKKGTIFQFYKVKDGGILEPTVWASQNYTVNNGVMGVNQANEVCFYHTDHVGLLRRVDYQEKDIIFKEIKSDFNVNCKNNSGIVFLPKQNAFLFVDDEGSVKKLQNSNGQLRLVSFDENLDGVSQSNQKNEKSDSTLIDVSSSGNRSVVYQKFLDKIKFIISQIDHKEGTIKSFECFSNFSVNCISFFSEDFFAVGNNKENVTIFDAKKFEPVRNVSYPKADILGLRQLKDNAFLAFLYLNEKNESEIRRIDFKSKNAE